MEKHLMILWKRKRSFLYGVYHLRGMDYASNQGLGGRVKTVDIYEKGIRSYTFTSFNEVTTTTGNYEIGRRADANPTTITS